MAAIAKETTLSRTPIRDLMFDQEYVGGVVGWDWLLHSFIEKWDQFNIHVLQINCVFWADPFCELLVVAMPSSSCSCSPACSLGPITWRGLRGQVVFGNGTGSMSDSLRQYAEVFWEPQRNVAANLPLAAIYLWVRLWSTPTMSTKYLGSESRSLCVILCSLNSTLRERMGAWWWRRKISMGLKLIFIYPSDQSDSENFSIVLPED